MYANDRDISYNNDLYANFIKRFHDAGMKDALIQSKEFQGHLSSLLCVENATTGEFGCIKCFTKPCCVK